MKKQFLSLMLSGLMLASMPVHLYSNAAEDKSASTLASENGISVYAAGLISRHTLSCTSGSKKVYINAEVYGSDTMAKLGFKNIKVQRSSDKKTWTTETTVPDQISSDTSYKFLSSYSVSVKGGYYYRIVLDHYAKEDTWWFPDTQTEGEISNSVWVP